MQRKFGTSIIGLIGLAILGSAALPAAAQGPRQSTRSSNRGSTQNQVIPPGSSVIVPVPPRTIWNPAEALVERDFMWMRSTAKDPNNFLYGKYNPGYQVVTPGPIIQPYPYPTYPNPGYYYGPQVFPNPLLTNRFGYGYGYNYGSNIQQRELIIIRDPSVYSAQQPSTEAPRPERQPERKPAPRSSETLKEDFYLGDKGRTEALPDALDDVRKAWLNGDFERLRGRFKADGAVRIFPTGKFKYSVATGEFLNVVKDAMTRIDTVAFEFDRPKSEEAGRAFVSGKHTFLDSEKKRQETFVSYSFQRIEGKWLIVEAGSSSSPITKHEE